MKHDRLLALSLILAGAWISGAGVPAVGQEPGPGQVNPFVEPGDPSLLTPEEMTPETDSRRVVDAFLVAAFTGDLDMVYDEYIHPETQAVITREEFAQSILEVKEVVGDLSRVILTYLRETNRTYEGNDGGWTENILIFEKDPRVDARVDFRRVDDGLWKIYNFAFASPVMERVMAAKAAMVGAGQGSAEPEADGQADPEEGSSPPRP